MQVAGANRSEGRTARPLHVYHPPAGQVLLEGARRFLFDLGPGSIRDGGKLAMEVIHGSAVP